MTRSDIGKGAKTIKENTPCKKCPHTPYEHSPLYRPARRLNRLDTAMHCHLCNCTQYQ